MPRDAGMAQKSCGLSAKPRRTTFCADPWAPSRRGSGPCIMAERLKSCRVARVDRIVVVKYRVPIFYCKFGAFGLCSWYQTSPLLVVQHGIFPKSMVQYTTWLILWVHWCTNFWPIPKWWSIYWDYWGQNPRIGWKKTVQETLKSLGAKPARFQFELFLKPTIENPILVNFDNFLLQNLYNWSTFCILETIHWKKIHTSEPKLHYGWFPIIIPL